MTRRCWMTEAEIKAVVDKACGHYRWPCTTPTQMIRPRSSVTGPEADYPGRRPVQWAHSPLNRSLHLNRSASADGGSG
jgi:hypothetical protein